MSTWPDSLKNLPWQEAAAQKAAASDDDLYCSLHSGKSYREITRGKPILLPRLTELFAVPAVMWLYDGDGETVLLYSFEEEADISHPKVIWQKK